MKEFKAGTLHSGSSKGPKVVSHAQAVAIALSEQRQQGKSVPPPKSHPSRSEGIQGRNPPQRLIEGSESRLPRSGRGDRALRAATTGKVRPPAEIAPIQIGRNSRPEPSTAAHRRVRKSSPTLRPWRSRSPSSDNRESPPPRRNRTHPDR